jgi:hypothetical protein
MMLKMYRKGELLFMHTLSWNRDDDERTKNEAGGLDKESRGGALDSVTGDVSNCINSPWHESVQSNKDIQETERWRA